MLFAALIMGVAPLPASEQDVGKRQDPAAGVLNPYPPSPVSTPLFSATPTSFVPPSYAPDIPNVPSLGGASGGGAPAGGAPAADASGGDASGGDASGGGASGGGASGGDASGGDTSGGDTSGGDTSGGDTSGGSDYPWGETNVCEENPRHVHRC